VPSEPLRTEGPAWDSWAIRFLGSIFTRLLAQNHDVFIGVLFTMRPYTPTPSVDIITRTSSPPAYDYFLKLCDYFLNKYDYLHNNYDYSVP
jgi:hypothetical protein